jgi:AraC family transcriptional regulator
MAELLAELLPPRARRADSRIAAHARRLVEDPDRGASVSAIGRELSVHPVYLARAFRQTYGCSIRDYRTIRNVRRAADALLATRKPLSQIAHEVGFADHSHMCRAFRTVAGWHPSLLRA